MRNVSKIRESNQMRAKSKADRASRTHYVSDGDAQPGYEEDAIVLDDSTTDLPITEKRAKPRGKNAAARAQPSPSASQNSDDESVEIVRITALVLGIPSDTELTTELVRQILLALLRAAKVGMRWLDDRAGAEEIESFVAILADEWGLVL